MTRGRQWVVFCVGAVAAAVLWLSLPPSASQDWDLVTYRATVGHMREGEGYYEAMTKGMVETGVGPVSAVHAYRLPTVFLLWRWCCLSWPATFVVVVLIGVLVGIAFMPLAGLGVLLWLAVFLHPVGAEQWAFVETWALPFALGALIAIQRNGWGWACLLALGAALVREQCVLLLLGGLVGAWRYRQAMLPWLVAILAWVAFFTWHIRSLGPYLVAQGREPPLSGGSIGAVVTMAGPYTYGLGIALLLYVLWRQRFTPAWWLTAPLLAAIPLSGFVTSRFHWGLLVLPLAVGLLGPQYLQAYTPRLTTNNPDGSSHRKQAGVSLRRAGTRHSGQGFSG